jgi:hypothetical protein
MARTRAADLSQAHWDGQVDILDTCPGRLVYVGDQSYERLAF